MRDMCESRVVPDRSGDMLTALGATGIHGWGPLRGKLVHLETIISNLTMAVTAREDVLRDLEVLRRSRRR